MKLGCGATAGAISQTLTYPLDVLRRRMQVTGMKSMGYNYNGSFDAISSIIRQEGLRGLYKGIWPNLIKVTPSTDLSAFYSSRLRLLMISILRYGCFFCCLRND